MKVNVTRIQTRWLRRVVIVLSWPIMAAAMVLSALVLAPAVALASFILHALLGVLDGSACASKVVASLFKGVEALNVSTREVWK